MITGLNQDIEILGRTFHVQTEVSGDDRLMIRTVVYVGGKVVASRETAVPDEVRRVEGEPAVRLLMRRQHAAIGRSLVERVTRYASERPGLGPAQKTKRTGYKMTYVGSKPGPPEPDSPTLQASLKIRRLVGRVRRRVVQLEEQALERRLIDLGAFLNLVVESPLFSDIRVDEQLRFNLIRERLGAWAETRDPTIGERIWRRTRAFVSYLADVNGRAELVEFDRQLVEWALSGAEDDPSWRSRLGSLYGRDELLDELLDTPDELRAARLEPELRRVQELLGD